MPRLRTCAWCESPIKRHHSYSYTSPITGKTYYFDNASCMDAFKRDATRDNS
jgi:YHS domain-containing protein